MIPYPIARFRDILAAPAETFRQVRDESLPRALFHFGICIMVFFAGFFLMVFALPHRAGVVAQRALIELAEINGALAVGAAVISFLVLHAAVYLFKGRAGIAATAKAFLYSLTPLLLFGGFFLGIGVQAILAVPLLCLWSLYYLFIGIRELHGMSGDNALGAVGGVVLFFIVMFVVMFVLTVLIMIPHAWVTTHFKLFPGFNFSINRQGDEVTITYLGASDMAPLEEFSELQVMKNGTSVGSLKLVAGSSLTVTEPSCPAMFEWIPVYGDGKKGYGGKIAEEQCRNDFVTITMNKTDENVTVRNNGGQRLGDVLDIRVTAWGYQERSLGVQPGAEISIPDKECETHVIVTAVLKSGARWKVADKKLGNCTDYIANFTILKNGREIIVRNNGGPRLDQVSELRTGIRTQVLYPLGTEPGSEVRFNTTYCNPRIFVQAKFIDGRTREVAKRDIEGECKI